MPARIIDDNEGGYWVNDDIEKCFFKNSQFCTGLKEYLFNLLSIQVEINLQTPPKKNHRHDEPMKYRVCVIDTSNNKPERQQAVSDCIKKLFKTIKSKSKQYDNDKVLKWFCWFIHTGGNLKFLQKLVNTKLTDMITVFEKKNDFSLCIYYLSKQSFSSIDFEKLEYFIQNEVVQETIPLPLLHERSPQLETELKEIESDKTIEDEVLIVQDRFFLKTKQKEIVLFGYDKKVNEIKKQVLNIIERNILITYKLNSIVTSFIDYYLPETILNELREIEKKYKCFGVDIRLGLDEFSAPQYLKDEIESSIQQLLSQSSSTTTKTFESIQLFKDIAEYEEKHLKSIARKNRCYIKTELKHTHQSHSVPKASISNIQVSKSIVAQSELFCSSTDVFKKMIIGNGSIELRTGDIALQEVDTIIISTTFNGLKEGVIERAGSFDYEKTHLQTDGTMYTETDGGKLICKRILFSNWLPTSLINNDNTLRISIQSFISKSIEYTKDTLSIAFAVPDSCTDENILAKEMITEAKRQLEINKLELKISFVLLPEQQTLYEQFSSFFETTQDVYAYFDWPITVITITLIATNVEHVTRCQERITKYLSRCINSAKITYTNAVFQSWNQHIINSFYKYCKDKCILLKLDETQNEIKLSGLASGIQETKKKFYILSQLVKEKVQCTSIIERPNSAVSRSTRSENLKMAKLYNIVVSYSRKDIRRCQRLINRLTEEGFSVGTDSDKRDICSQMDKSDCIILCISENYYENLLCIEEAKYAFQTDKKVFLVKIQNNPLFCWDYDLFEGKLFFRSFGSDHYFDLEYGRLLIELLRYTKPGFTSLLQQRSSCIQQDNDEFPGVSQNTTTSTRQLTFIEERWLRKLRNIPILVKMPADSYKVSDLFIQSILPTNCAMQSNKPFDCGYYHRPITEISTDEDQTYGKCTKKIQPFVGLSEVFPPDCSTDDFIPRRTNTNYSNSYFSTGWRTENSFRNEEEIEKRQKFENPEEMKHVREKLAKYFMEKYKCYTTEQLEVYSKFAQRMRDNTMAFETFCSTNV